MDQGTRTGVNHVVKILAWWNKQEKQMQSITLDINGAGKTTEEIADAVQHSLQKLSEENRFLAGMCSDSGGGGTKEGLMYDTHVH